MKKNTRVEIPRNAKDIVELASKIVKYHDELGPESPILNAIDMDAFKVLLEEARVETENSDQLRKAAEAATENRNKLVGIAKDQSVTTRGTVLQMVTSIRDVLLGTYKGVEHQMGSFGFTVASSARSASNDETGENGKFSDNGANTASGSNDSNSDATQNDGTDVESAPAADS